MRRRSSLAALSSAVLSALTLGVFHVRAEARQAAAPVTAPAARGQDAADGAATLDRLPDGPGPEAFSGRWDYNAVESVNIATGRPEQSPAAARRSQPGSGRVAGQPPPRSWVAGPPTGRVGTGVPDLGVDPDVEMRAARYRQILAAENRALVRDLTEVPETLSIQVSGDAVTFTDDLDRTLTFPTDQTRQKYQLSASIFDARAHWDGRKLVKDIEGPRGFRMTETYFLSQDGRRLFVILRIGEGKPDEPPVGYDRVYDRVDGGSGGGR